MVNIIVVLPKLEEAKTVKSILARNGFQVSGVSSTGAQAIQMTEGLPNGLIISGYKMNDMLFSELQDCMPLGFEMLLLASQKVITEDFEKNLVCLSLPLKVNDLVNTVSMMVEGIERKRRKKQNVIREHSAQETALITEAKKVLIIRNHMTEEEAHKYLQKSSMDSGVGLAEVAQMVLAMMKK